MNNIEKIALQQKLISKNEEVIETYRTALKEKIQTIDEAMRVVFNLREELKQANQKIKDMDIELETLKPFKPAEVVYMTHNELRVLKDVNDAWHENEGGYSEYSSAFITISKSEAGTLSSLLKKELIYDCYDSYEDEEPMWCMTTLGASLMISEGHEYDMELIYKNQIENVRVVIQ